MSKPIVIHNPSNRLVSLDFFRGATVAAMIVVNDPGNWEFKYGQLSHAVWEGCTFTDLIFPFFLFIVGVSITLSFGRSLKKGTSRQQMALKTLKRSGIIFLLGLFLNLFPEFDLAQFRLLGVLQRIALVFLACAMIYLFIGKRSQLYLFSCLQVGYYLILTYLPVPGIGPANLDPSNNFSAWFDRLILNGYLGTKGLATYDNNGIFSTIPAIASGMSGMFAGYLLKQNNMDEKTRLIWLFIAGCLMMFAGWVFSFEFPMIKRIWTASYVLHTSGIAFLCFAGAYWFLDILRYLRLTPPFLAFGVNALTAYFIAGIWGKLSNTITFIYHEKETVPKQWFYEEVFLSFFDRYNASLAYAIVNTCLILIPVWIMYRKGLVVKV